MVVDEELEMPGSRQCRPMRPCSENQIEKRKIGDSNTISIPLALFTSIRVLLRLTQAPAQMELQEAFQ
jgi:hypothetical protein